MPSSPNGPCSTGNDGVRAQQPAARRAAPAPRRRASTRRRARAARRAPRARPRPRPRARTRPSPARLVLGRAPAGEDGDPHGVGRRRRRRRRASGRGRRSKRADGDRHRRRPSVALRRRAAGVWSITTPSCVGSRRSVVSLSGDLEAGVPRARSRASSTVVGRHVRHRDLRRRLGDDQLDRRALGAPACRPPASCSSTVPGSLSASPAR